MFDARISKKEESIISLLLPLNQTNFQSKGRQDQPLRCCGLIPNRRQLLCVPYSLCGRMPKRKNECG